MRALLVAFITLLSLGLAELKIGYNFSNDGFNFKSILTGYYNKFDGESELVVDAKKYMANGQDKTDVHINYEYDYASSITKFYYADYMYDKFYSQQSGKIGSGVSIVPDGYENILGFPFRHKLSLAINYYTRYPNLVYPSWRYKITGHVLGLGFNTIYQWHLDDYIYTQDLTYRLKPELEIKYRAELETVQGVSKKTDYLIMEMKL